MTRSTSRAQTSTAPNLRNVNPSKQVWNSLSQDIPEHRPCSRYVRERMECYVVIYPPLSIYPAGNGVLCDQCAIRYNCQNDNSTVVFTVRDLVHWNYVTSKNIPRMCTSWISLSIHVFATYIFSPSDTHSTGVNFRYFAERPWQIGPFRIREGNCNYCHTNTVVGKSKMVRTMAIWIM